MGDGLSAVSKLHAISVRLWDQQPQGQHHDSRAMARQGRGAAHLSRKRSTVSQTSRYLASMNSPGGREAGAGR